MSFAVRDGGATTVNKLNFFFVDCSARNAIKPEPLAISGDDNLDEAEAVIVR